MFCVVFCWVGWVLFLLWYVFFKGSILGFVVICSFIFFPRLEVSQIEAVNTRVMQLLRPGLVRACSPALL